MPKKTIHESMTDDLFALLDKWQKQNIGPEHAAGVLITTAAYVCVRHGGHEETWRQQTEEVWEKAEIVVNRQQRSQPVTVEYTPPEDNVIEIKRAEAGFESFGRGGGVRKKT